MGVKPLATAGAVVLLLVGAVARAGADPASACREKKLSAAARYGVELFRASVKHERRPDAVKQARRLSRARAKLAKAFAKAERTAVRRSTVCDTVADASGVQQRIDSFIGDLILGLRRPVTSASTSTTTSTTVGVSTSLAPSTATSSTSTLPYTTTTTLGSCAGTEYPACGGSCPPGQTCQAVHFISVFGPGCECVPAFESCSAFCGQAPGTCPAGQVCIVNDTVGVGRDCGCAPTPHCYETSLPTCGGSCPGGGPCLGLVACACP